MSATALVLLDGTLGVKVVCGCCIVWCHQKWHIRGVHLFLGLVATIHKKVVWYKMRRARYRREPRLMGGSV